MPRTNWLRLWFTFDQSGGPFERVAPDPLADCLAGHAELPLKWL